MKKWPFVLGGTVLLLILIAAYLGFVPGLSSLLGASTPRDLGVRPTDEDFASASQKLERTIVTLPGNTAPEDSLTFEGSHPIDTALTAEEFTAIRQRSTYAYGPLGKEFQAVFHEDGTVEVSGTLVKRNIVPWGKAFRLDEARMRDASDKLDAYQTDPAFYAKGKVVIEDNVPSIEIEEAVLGKVPLPQSMIPEGAMDEIAAQAIGNVPGLRIDSLTVDEGEMRFQGTYPDTIGIAGG